MNLGGLDGSVSTLGGMLKITGKAAGLARRAVYAVSVRDLSVFVIGRYEMTPRGVRQGRYRVLRAVFSGNNRVRRLRTGFGWEGPCSAAKGHVRRLRAVVGG